MAALKKESRERVRPMAEHAAAPFLISLRRIQGESPEVVAFVKTIIVQEFSKALKEGMKKNI